MVIARKVYPIDPGLIPVDECVGRHNLGHARDTAVLTYDEIAARHGITEGAVKAAAHRLRQGFRTALRRAIAETVTTEEEIEEEIRHLFTVFQAT